MPLKISKAPGVYSGPLNVPFPVVDHVPTALVPPIEAKAKFTVSPSHIVTFEGAVTVGVALIVTVSPISELTQPIPLLFGGSVY